MILIGKQKQYKNVFKNINTKQKAYILGLIAADGYINKKATTLELSLKVSDRIILDEIKQSLGKNLTIKIKKDKRPNRENMARLFLFGNEMLKHLQTKGFDNNKTFSLKFPYYIEDKLMPHFIRGYFDGDGCISYYVKDNQTYVFSQFIGTLNFVEGCQSYFLRNNIKSNFYKEGVIYRLKVYGIKENKKLFELLYNYNSIYFLKRKYDIFVKVKNYIFKQKVS